MNTPVTPPTAVTQWTAADVAQAKANGRHDLIAQAHAAGQLDAVIASGDLAQPVSPSASKQSTPMDHNDAIKFLAAQEGPQS